MTDFQSALELALIGDLYFHITAHTLKNLHLSGIERVPPSLTIFEGGGIALLQTLSK